VLTTQLSQSGTGKDMSSEDKSADEKPPKFRAIVPKQLKIVRVIK